MRLPPLAGGLLAWIEAQKLKSAGRRSGASHGGGDPSTSAGGAGGGAATVKLGCGTSKPFEMVQLPMVPPPTAFAWLARQHLPAPVELVMDEGTIQRAVVASFDEQMEEVSVRSGLAVEAAEEDEDNLEQQIADRRVDKQLVPTLCLLPHTNTSKHPGRAPLRLALAM